MFAIDSIVHTMYSLYDESEEYSLYVEQEKSDLSIRKIWCLKASETIDCSYIAEYTRRQIFSNYPSLVEMHKIFPH